MTGIEWIPHQVRDDFDPPNRGTTQWVAPAVWKKLDIKE
jgi:hypothetical protein